MQSLKSYYVQGDVKLRGIEIDLEVQHQVADEMTTYGSLTADKKIILKQGGSAILALISIFFFK